MTGNIISMQMNKILMNGRTLPTSTATIVCTFNDTGLKEMRQ